MIPEPSKALLDIAMRLGLNVLPNIPDAFNAADTGLIAQLLMTFSQEFEHAIEHRLNDIAEMKDLIRGAPQTAERNTFLASEPASFALADVNALHDEGTRLLIELHAWAEIEDDALNNEIWAYLRRHAERHQFALP